MPCGVRIPLKHSMLLYVTSGKFRVTPVRKISKKCKKLTIQSAETLKEEGNLSSRHVMCLRKEIVMYNKCHQLQMCFKYSCKN